MDAILIIVGIILLICGLVGSVAPIVPGPILSLIGILIVQYSQRIQFSSGILVIVVLAVFLSMILDYYLPVWGTKKYGGTQAGVVGSTVGMIAGIFFLPPLGMILLPCIGAFLAEYYISKLHGKAALRAARGSFVGFILGTGYKLILCGWILIITIVQLI